MSIDRMSIVVSVFNRLDNLDRCLLSIALQSFQCSEVIVSDDGSSEDVLGFLKKAAPNYPFNLKYVRQENLGFRLSRCKNNGIRHADGDYVVFIDQDIIATRAYLETFARNASTGQFLVATPIWLDETQTLKITDDLIRTGQYDSLILPKQRRKMMTQFRKDWIYYWDKKLLALMSNKPKVRGGVFGVHRATLSRVNGFDEQYQGWGNEDDDLGRRLCQIGTVGRNVFNREFPLHLYHPPTRKGRERPNLEYYRKREVEIARGSFHCEFGLDNTLGEDVASLTIVR